MEYGPYHLFFMFVLRSFFDVSAIFYLLCNVNKKTNDITHKKYTLKIKEKPNEKNIYENERSEMN